MRSSLKPRAAPIGCLGWLHAPPQQHVLQRRHALRLHGFTSLSHDFFAGNIAMANQKPCDLVMVIVECTEYIDAANLSSCFNELPTSLLELWV
jgi:hypothetical protein